jgi:cytochrome c-type biogenesis protein CcmH/NrfG
MTRNLVLLAIVAALALYMVIEFREGIRPRSTSEVASTPSVPTPSKSNVSRSVLEKIKHLRDIVERNPSDSKSALELAKMYQDGHNLPEAIAYYEHGLQRDQQNLVARIDYSLCLYEAGKQQEAMVQNFIVLNSDARNPQALYNLGAIYANRQRSDSARYYWTKLIDVHPNDDLAAQARQNLNALSGTKSK